MCHMPTIMIKMSNCGICKNKIWELNFLEFAQVLPLLIFQIVVFAYVFLPKSRITDSPVLHCTVDVIQKYEQTQPPLYNTQ